MLTTSQFAIKPDTQYEVVKGIPENKRTNGGSRIGRRFASALAIWRTRRIISEFARKGAFKYLLFAAYAEYLAPLWSWRFSRLARSGMVIGSVVHDPVRDFVVGPAWWHRLSVHCAYSFVDVAFVHSPIELDTGGDVRGLRTHVIPHGLYRLPAPLRSREQTRDAFGIPADAPVLLSFGHIRDGKNLDLVLQMLQRFPGVYLVVAGQEQSAGQKPGPFYRQLADDLGIGERCRWLLGYVPDGEAAALFHCADLAVLAYSRAFRSASGVLNAAATCRTPCLASGGAGELEDAVNTYDLGIWVEPDDLDALCRGFEQWSSHPPQPRWLEYEADHSWHRNAELVIAALEERNAG